MVNCLASKGEWPSKRDGFAVLLNANAKQVTDRVRRSLERVVGDDDVFLSRSKEDAQAIADTVIARSYGTVFTGGGDGTFVGWVNRILDRAERRSRPAPRFGVLALGTGNAVAEVVGARADDHMRDLAAFASGAASNVRRLHLLTWRGRRTPFAGLGIDAAILNDYCWLRELVTGTRLERHIAGVPGYALSAALRSAPRYLVDRSSTYCEIVNLGRPACRLDARGRQIGPPIGPGELLYAGPCMMAAASTVPFYGFGFRVFPFAERRPGTFQLRIVSDLTVPAVLWNLPRIWSGAFAHPSLFDFHADRVEVHLDAPMPLQVGGDAEGWHDQVTFGMARQDVELVDFKPRPAPRCLVA